MFLGLPEPIRDRSLLRDRIPALQIQTDALVGSEYSWPWPDLLLDLSPGDDDFGGARRHAIGPYRSEGENPGGGQVPADQACDRAKSRRWRVRNARHLGFHIFGRIELRRKRASSITGNMT